MTNGEILRQLFRGFAQRDDSAFRTAAEKLIKEEREKNHRLLADDLERILLNGNGTHIEKKNAINPYEVPKDRERGFPLLDIAEYAFDWERIVLAEKSLNILKRIAKEHHHKDLLASGGVRPTQKVLFFGPPGCGKTLAAQVLSAILYFPLVTVRFDAVVSSYLGETAANLRRVFDFVRRGQWVVLFDEFDAIGKDRDNLFEHGELKRVVNTLLQLMDAFRGESLLIAATNHEGLLDKAVWRRFESVVQFSLPSLQDRILMLRQFLRGFDYSNLNLEAIAKQMRDATGADIERLCLESVRLALLESRNQIYQKDAQAALSSFRERMTISRQLSQIADNCNKQANRNNKKNS
ncbi:MAG: AAA family ATPase [Acidobacteriota bacterium]